MNGYTPNVIVDTCVLSALKKYFKLGEKVPSRSYMEGGDVIHVCVQKGRKLRVS